jgi:hypothetical protein
MSPVVFSPSQAQVGLQIESWACWFARELVESVNELAASTGSRVERLLSLV